MKAGLILENGSFYEGLPIGKKGDGIGEVVLNTAVVGYQEMMTDPANAGKILVLTYPLIGNYGISDNFYESSRCWLAGLIIKESSRIYSNWQAKSSFGDFLKKEEIITLSEIDTRTLAVEIRDNGQICGMISSAGASKEALEKIKEHRQAGKADFIKHISVKKMTEVTKGLSGPNIAVIDLGMQNSFTRQLKRLGCNITLFPYSVNADEMLSMRFDGLIVSNGPEDDRSTPQIVDTVGKLIGKLPMMGISTGHEILGLACGAKLKKMRVGHHGVNYPVKSDDPDSYTGEITVQNHSFVIDDEPIKDNADIRISSRNINDHTIEAMGSETLRFISVQYYPSSPGFDEVNKAFVKFLKMMPRRKQPKEVQHAET